MINRNHIIPNIWKYLSALSVFTIILILVTILFIVIKNGASYVSIEFLTQAPKEGMTAGGIFPAIFGTFLMVIIMTIAGVPIGVITALYLTEYASKNSKLAQIIRFAINILAGVPSIVFGLFGLGFFVQFIGGNIDKFYGSFSWGQPNLLWASLTMALLTLPTVIVTVEEALKSVPNEFREASYALGATKLVTIWKVVLPNSISGIMTGIILAISRGAGEVAPILFTGVAYFLPELPTSVTNQFMHLGYHLYIMATQSVDVEATLPIQFATTLVLLGLTFLLNLTAVIIRQKLRSKMI